MKRSLLLFISLFFICCAIGCSNAHATRAIELMGAGDRIHDTYTFANTGVKISNENNTYTISGSVESLNNEAAKKEFKIADDISHVVAIKLTAIDCEVNKDTVNITVDGVRNYDAEHLNGSNYTFIILEAVPDSVVSIKVNWCGEDEKTYIVKFDKDLILK